MRRTAALILGGGPAGSAAGIVLGARALILERSAEPQDALCGGFLSWRTLGALAALGIEADDLNPARITRLRLFAGRHVTEARLPAAAVGVTRRRLDALLLDRAARAGAAVERGVMVRGWDAGITRLDDGAALHADATLLATGKHELRGFHRAHDAADPALGLRLRLAPAAALDRLIGGAIELHLFDRGYAGLARHEDGSANLCLAVHRSRLHEAGSPAALIAALGGECPALVERLAHVSLAPIDAIANVPYGWRARDTVPGLYRLGDQAGVIPSLAGEGMGIAIASGVSAARAILTGEASSEWQRRFAHTLYRPLNIAGLIRTLAESQGTAALLTLAACMPGVARGVARLTRIKQESVDDSLARSHI